MSLLLNKNYRLHKLKNKATILIHERSLFKQYIVLIIIFQRTLRLLFTSKSQRFLKIFIYFKMSTWLRRQFFDNVIFSEYFLNVLSDLKTLMFSSSSTTLNLNENLLFLFNFLNYSLKNNTHDASHLTIFDKFCKNVEDVYLKTSKDFSWKIS